MKFVSRSSRRSLGFVLVLLAAGVALWQPASVQAVAFTLSGTISTTDPVYNRPLNTTSLSSVGTSVYFDVQSFTVSATGVVALAVDSATFTPTPADDSYLVLYQNAFNPASPLTNIVAIDDDSGPGSLSLISITLTAGVPYFLVISPYYNATTGPYTASITPATGTTLVIPAAVPEPTSVALLGVGLLGGFAAWKRRG